jgi:hypothetical protein
VELATISPGKAGRATRAQEKPLTVSHTRARQLLGVGKTKYWQLVKDGKVQVVRVGRCGMATYASIEATAAGA